jgi:hypothetical protein
MAVQQGRSERSGEAYSAPYGEPLSDARTPLADFFSILLGTRKHCRGNYDTQSQEERDPWQPAGGFKNHLLAACAL